MNNELIIDLTSIPLTTGTHSLLIEAVTRDGLATKVISDPIVVTKGANGEVNTQVSIFQMYEGDPLEGLPADCPQWVIDRVSQIGWVQPNTKEEVIQALNMNLPIKLKSSFNAGGYSELFQINSNYVIIDFNSHTLQCSWGWDITADHIALISTSSSSEFWAGRGSPHEFSTEPYMNNVTTRIGGVY